MDKKLSVLLVEDNPGDVLLIKKKLDKTSFPEIELLVADSLNGVNQYATLSKEITLILLDLNLPDGSGVESVKYIKRVFSDTPIIVLTGLDHTEIALETLREGAQNYLVKSEISYRELEQSIRFALERNTILFNLKQNELRFRSLIEHNHDSITLTNANGKLQNSPKEDKLLGFTVDSEQTIYDFVHPNDVKILAETYQQALKVPSEPIHFSLRARHSSGEYLWVEGTVTNMLQNTAVNSVVLNYRDISKRKKAEEEIYALNQTLEEKVKVRTKQLEATNKDLESFSYTVSHDLRSPLSSMSSIISIFKADYANNLPDEAKTFLGLMGQCSDKMFQIIDALLSFSKLGAQALSKSEIDMTSLVNEVVEEATENKPKQTIVNVSKLPSISGDSSLIRQVWTNLITNAVKYSSKKDNPTIDIGAEVLDDKVTYFVKDNGAGFDMENADKLFKTFQRLHSDNEFEGTGVGLSLVYRIVDKHGGKIWAEAKKGEGATFWFTLPIEVSEES